jgi:hypothetical protein
MASERAGAAGQQGDEARALRLLGDAAATRGPAGAAEAERAYRRALAIAEAAAMRPLIARCQTALARLFHQRGDAVAAARCLDAARDVLRAMDVPASPPAPAT